jgi:tetratricopeptide (TPR) repeat protein
MNSRFLLIIASFLWFTSCKVKQQVSAVNKKGGLFTTVSKPMSEIKQEQFFIEGCRRRINGDFNAAIAQFNEVLKINPQNDAALYYMALVYMDKREYNRALQYIEPALKLNTTNKWYRITAADIYEATGRFIEAANLMAALAKQYPAEMDFLFDQAYFLIKAEQYEKAILVYNQIEKTTGLNEEVATARKQLWLKLNKPDKAIAEIQSLIKLNPSNPDYYAMLADLYMSMNMNDKALQSVQKIADLDSTNIKAQTILSEYYINQSDYDRAFPNLYSVFKSSSVNVDFKIKLLLSYMDRLQEPKRKNEALSLGSLLTEVHPSEPKALCLYADILAQCNEDAEALQYYYQTLQIDKSRFSVWRQVFLLQSRLHLNNDLLNYTEEAKELFPYQPLVYYYNGIAWLDKKNYNKAIISLETVLRFDIDDDGLRSQVEATLGDCYEALQDYNLASRHYENAINIDPNNVYALNNYAYHLAQRGVNLDKAEQLSGKVVLKLSTNNPNYIDTYAWILFKQKKYAQALSWMEKAITPNTNNAQILEHYGDMLFQVGKVDEAVSYWQKALEFTADKSSLLKKINDRKLAD